LINKQKRFIFNGQPATGLETTVLAVVNVLLVIPNLILSMSILVPSFSFVGWVIGVTPLGVWVADGLKLLYINVQSEDIYKIAAAAGFAKSFLTSGRTFKERNS
jgi:hypothetical protein